MDQTPEIRNATVSIEKEYVIIVNALLMVLDKPREERDAVFQAAIKKLSAEAKTHLGLINLREQIHFDFMQVVFAKGYELKYRKPIPKSVPVHDHTKDELFYFILAANFDVFIGKGDAVVEEEKDQTFKDGLSKMVKLELDRHYSHEPHHPEYEKLNNKECQEQDILEMAVDRLARNVQFNHGNVDMDRMEKFLPKFTLGNTEEKREMYRKSVRLCKDMVSETAKEMYFNCSVSQRLSTA